MGSLEERVKAEVEKVIDPETGLTFGQMEMIKSLKEVEPGVVRIEFVPSSPFCPIAFKLAMDVRRTAERVEGVKRAYVYCQGHIMKEAIDRMVNEEENPR